MLCALPPGDKILYVENLMKPEQKAEVPGRIWPKLYTLSLLVINISPKVEAPFLCPLRRSFRGTQVISSCLSVAGNFASKCRLHTRFPSDRFFTIYY